MLRGAACIVLILLTASNAAQAASMTSETKSQTDAVKEAHQIPILSAPTAFQESTDPVDVDMFAPDSWNPDEQMMDPTARAINYSPGTISRDYDGGDNPTATEDNDVAEPASSLEIHSESQHPLSESGDDATEVDESSQDEASSGASEYNVEGTELAGQPEVFQPNGELADMSTPSYSSAESKDTLSDGNDVVDEAEQTVESEEAATNEEPTADTLAKAETEQDASTEEVTEEDDATDEEGAEEGTTAEDEQDDTTPQDDATEAPAIPVDDASDEIVEDGADEQENRNEATEDGAATVTQQDETDTLEDPTDEVNNEVVYKSNGDATTYIATEEPADAGQVDNEDVTEDATEDTTKLTNKGTPESTTETAEAAAELDSADTTDEKCMEESSDTASVSADDERARVQADDATDSVYEEGAADEPAEMQDEDPNAEGTDDSTEVPIETLAIVSQNGPTKFAALEEPDENVYEKTTSTTTLDSSGDALGSSEDTKTAGPNSSTSSSSMSIDPTADYPSASIQTPLPTAFELPTATPTTLGISASGATAPEPPALPPTTSVPLTPAPTTLKPPTPAPTTSAPATSQPPSPSPTTAPLSPKPVTPAPTTPELPTPAPTTPEPPTLSPLTPESPTPAPSTTPPVTPAPTNPETQTPAPTPARTTPEPATLAPIAAVANSALTAMTPTVVVTPIVMTPAVPASPAPTSASTVSMFSSLTSVVAPVVPTPALTMPLEPTPAPTQFTPSSSSPTTSPEPATPTPTFTMISSPSPLDSDLCPAGETSVSVLGKTGVFCVASDASICSSTISDGLCPKSQLGLEEGSFCDRVSENVPAPFQRDRRWRSATQRFMNSPFSPEAYRRLLDVDAGDGSARDEDQDAFMHPQMLSFVDWDVLDGPYASRMLRQYDSWLKGLHFRKQLRKPVAQGPLAPLAASPPILPMVNLAADYGRSNVIDAQRSPQRAQALAASPFSPRKQGHSVNKSSGTLPPLDVQVLQRKRVFLNATGGATIGIEEIVKIQERLSPPKPRASPLQLAVIPKKCVDNDEVALMPCYSLQYRYVPSLAAEIWREPLRDRDKNWSRDELQVILAMPDPLKKKCAMSNPLRHCKGKWTHWETMKLHVHRHPDSGSPVDQKTTSVAGSPPQRDQLLPSQILIRNQGAMISKTYCLVSVYGIGIYGRLYSSGLTERHGNMRFLRIVAYDPSSSHVYTLVVTFHDLEWVFQTRPEFLVAGKKHEIIKELIALLYFNYPDDEDESNVDVDARGGTQAKQPIHDDGDGNKDAGRLKEDMNPWPALCISPEEKLNAAARRRLEREERLRWEEEERLRTLATFMKLPRRARYRILCRVMRLNGHKMIVSIYHFPTQIRNFVVLAYHPASGRTFNLTVSVMDAASLTKIFTLPHKWNVDQKLHVAESLLPRLHFKGAKVTAAASVDDGAISDPLYTNYKMVLVVQDDRSGSPSKWLSPSAIQTIEDMQQELVKKYQVNGQRTLQLEFAARMQALEAENDAKITLMEAQIQGADDKKVKLHARDVELREKIEEINSGKGIPVTPQGDDAVGAESAKEYHDTRRGYKAARKQIKNDVKALNEQIASWKREMREVRESEQLEREKATRKLETGVRALENEALVSTRGVLDQGARICSMSVALTQRIRRENAVLQHAWLTRAHIDPNTHFITSGSCVVDRKRYRFSIFDVLSRNHEDEERTTTSSELTAPADEAELYNARPITEIPNRMLQIAIYDPSSCQTFHLTIACLDWISYTKQQHDAQLLVPHFAIVNSPVTERMKALDEALNAARQTLTKVNKKPTKKNMKARDRVREEMQRLLLERHQLMAAAPWHQVMAALSERMTIAASTIAIDRCIFRTVVPIASLAGSEDDNDANTAIYCHVRVVQELHVVTFEVYDPVSGNVFALAYPESVELAKEFAVETFVEQQLHLEAIAMSLLFFTNEQTGNVDLRFEE